uniref:Putative DNA primase n=1 Tax=viral metagenome TaxID=1070528 RepID=A0A6M3IZ16_9ZZZZ
MVREWPADMPLDERARILKQEKAAEKGAREQARLAKEAAREAKIQEAKASGAPTRPETPDEERTRALNYQAEVPAAGEGTRYDECLSLCGRLSAAGFTVPAAYAALVAFAQRCDPPLSEDELRELTLDKYLDDIAHPTIREIRVSSPILPPNPPPPPEDPKGDPSPQPRTYDIKYADRQDYGHALQLWALIPDRLLWAYHRKSWMEYDGIRWTPVPENRALVIASDALRSYYAHALTQDPPEAEAKRLVARISETCIVKRMRAALDFYAGNDPILILNAEQWDAHPWLLNCRNGTLDLQSNALLPHDPAHMLTHCAQVDYDPAATAPAFDAHLNLFLPNPNVQRQVLRDLGRALVGTTLEEAMPIWYGTGANGKTVTTRTVMGVLGDYARKAAPDLLVQRKHEQHPEAIADLIGARAVFAVETEERARLAEATVKTLTGGDRITTRFLYGQRFEAELSFSLFFVTNHQPTIHSTDEGIWRRVKEIPWAYEIPLDQRKAQDHVVQELLSQSPGILNSLIAGLQDYLQTPHWTAPEVQEATNAYRAEQDILADFLSEYCETHPDAFIPVGELYDKYKGSLDNEFPIAKTTFSKRLRGRGFQQATRGHKNTRCWIGLRIKRVYETF